MTHIYIQDNGVFILNYLLNLYTSLVRPHLEYACQVWDPYTERNIDHLEKVQKYALRICNGTQGMGIFLEHFSFPDYLADESRYLRLVTLFQLHTHHFYFPPGVLTQSRATSNRRTTSHAYTIPFAHTTAFQQSFIPRTISVWNNLPEDIYSRYFKYVLKISYYSIIV